MTFLERMAASSRERVRAARALESEAALERRAQTIEVHFDLSNTLIHRRARARATTIWSS